MISIHAELAIETGTHTAFILLPKMAFNGKIRFSMM